MKWSGSSARALICSATTLRRWAGSRVRWASPCPERSSATTAALRRWCVRARFMNVARPANPNPTIATSYADTSAAEVSSRGTRFN